MALPLVPIALGVTALAALGYAVFHKPGTKELPLGSGPAMPANYQPPPGTPGSLEAPAQGMPPELRAAYQQLLANGQDPAALDEVAARLEQYGYRTEAAQLRAKAADLRRSRPAPAPPPTGPVVPPVPPFVVPPTPGSIAPPVPALGKATVTASPGANVRTGPGVSFPLVSANDAYLGRTVDVVALNAGPPTPEALLGWTQVRTPGGSIGFTSTSNLSFLGGIVGPAPLPTAASTQTATVTASPGLNVRTSPSTSASLVPSNDAYKGMKVTILAWNAAPADGAAPQGWAQVKTPGGSVGYASKSYLILDAPSPVAAGVFPTIHVGSNGAPTTARCVAPSGCRLRREPRPDARHDAGCIVPNNGVVRVHDLLKLPQKSDKASPGQPGWARVEYRGRRGWIPSEWLLT